MRMGEQNLSPELKTALARTKGSVTPEQKRMSEELFYRVMNDSSLPFQSRMGYLHHAVLSNPFHGPAVEAYGWQLSQMKEVDYAGFLMLERSFRSDMDNPLDPTTKKGHWIASLVGRYNHTQHKYDTAKKFFLKAYKSPSNNDDANLLQLATCMTAYPQSLKDAKKQLADFHKYMDLALKKEKFNLPPHAAYDFVILSAFNFELYYEADIRECMHKYYLLTVKVFPSLIYSSRVFSTGKQKIGIASGFFDGEKNSVMADFKGVIHRLDRSKYQFVFINIIEKGHRNDFPWKDEHRIEITSEDVDWLDRARTLIESHSFDLILYLDSTMSSSVQQLMMSKLARVQAVSHGHPVTSGIPKETMNYFVSWGAAELPTAQDHYTEQLILLDANTMHQYYNHRVDDNGNSVITNEPYGQFQRIYFETLYHVPVQRRWYTCMQKPFKLHPEFDEMCLSILEKDRNGVLILHDCDHQEQRDVFQERLNKFIDRIYFVPALPHHILMGLYNLSDVILDSYYAGGCTTTREALEIGAPVVTLPGKYLGGRWSYAYYQIMEYTELIAESKEHYVELALKVGPEHKERILANVHKIFHREEAVQSWTNVIDTMLES